MADITPEGFADGLALWDEHKPQSGEDWVGVAERTLEAGETGEKGSPLFHGLVIATARAEAAEHRLDAAIEALKQIADELGVPSDDHPAPVANASEIARKALELSDLKGER